MNSREMGNLATWQWVKAMVSSFLLATFWFVCLLSNAQLNVTGLSGQGWDQQALNKPAHSSDSKEL